MKLTREEAWALFTEYNESESLRNHGLAVEGVMRYFARKYGEDEDFWGIVGLLHDLDYEKYPEEHCKKTRESETLTTLTSMPLNAMATASVPMWNPKSGWKSSSIPLMN